MKPSEVRERAQREPVAPKREVTAGDMLAGDQFARTEWQARIEQGDNTLARLAAAHSAFHQGHKNLRAATQTRDPEATPEAHFMRTRKMGEDWVKRSGEQASRALEFARTEIDSERRKLVEDLGLVEDHRASEVRGTMRGLKDQERMKLLQEAIEGGDAATIAAVTAAPAYLSGLSSERAQALRRQYEQRHAAERLARIDTLTKAAEVVDTTLSQAVVFQAELHPQHRAAEIEAKQKAARDMQAKLNAPI